MSEPSKEQLLALAQELRCARCETPGLNGKAQMPIELIKHCEDILTLCAAKPERERVITDEMVEAGCRARHSVRTWNRQLNNADMAPWVKSHREEMRTILTAALKGDPA